MKMYWKYLLLLMFPIQAYSQSLWLEPAKFLFAKGHSLKLHIKTSGLNGIVCSSDIRKLELHYGGAVDDLRPLIPDSIPADSLTLQFFDEGTAMVSVDVIYGHAEDTMIDANLVSAQLENERKQEHLHCSKSVFQVGSLRDSEFKRKSQSLLQFIPLHHPYSVKNGEMLAFKLLYKDSAVADAEVLVIHQRKGESVTKELKTDRNGMISVPVELAGKFMLYSKRSELVENERDAGWKSVSASFTWGY
jgi:hypothetical protein